MTNAATKEDGHRGSHGHSPLPSVLLPDPLSCTYELQVVPPSLVTPFPDPRRGTHKCQAVRVKGRDGGLEGGE